MSEQTNAVARMFIDPFIDPLYTEDEVTFTPLSTNNNPSFPTNIPPLVPVPAAAWLFASGLGLLGWMRRRQTI